VHDVGSTTHGFGFQVLGSQFKCHHMLFFVLCRYDIALFLAHRRNRTGEVVRITDILLHMHILPFQPMVYLRHSHKKAMFPWLVIREQIIFLAD
jgi:hypothetical protein